MEQRKADIDIGMRRCNELAVHSRACGEAPVGAVVVHGSRIIAESGERVHALRDVTAHAELLALRLACAALGTTDLSDCILCTNVEPCWMCSYVLRETGISTVAIRAAVPEIGGVTSPFAILTVDSVDGWQAPPAIVWLASR